MNDFIKYDVQEIKTQLQSHALTVCAKYLSNGKQSGHNWIVGSLDNQAGNSMSVNLNTGFFKDFATNDQGDLLEILKYYHNNDFKQALDEASSIIGDTILQKDSTKRSNSSPKIAHVSNNQNIKQAYDIFTQGKPIQGTLAETYLHNRGIKFTNFATLKFVPELVTYDEENIPHKLPCLIAGVTNKQHILMGIQRIFLDENGDKAKIVNNKRSLGSLSGNGVWLKRYEHIENLIIAEGLETALSVQNLLDKTTIATLGTANMINFIVPQAFQHIIIAQDNDEAGTHSATILKERLITEGFKVSIIAPLSNDFNDDLKEFSESQILQHIKSQLHN